MPNMDSPYHSLDGIEQLLADGIANGWIDAYDELVDASPEGERHFTVHARNLRTATGDGQRDAIMAVACAAARALSATGIVQVASDCSVSDIADLLIIGRAEWSNRGLSAAERTAMDALADDDGFTVGLTDESRQILAKRLARHGLLHTYAPHHQSDEVSPHTKGDGRAAWYRSHNFNDPEA